MLETAFGRETRPQLFINMLNRLRTLDFTPERQGDAAELGAVCTRCELKQKAMKADALDEDSNMLLPSSSADDSTKVEIEHQDELLLNEGD